MEEIRKVVKYLCFHKCGHSAFTIKKKAIEHQEICWKNPKNKTCKTCIHEVYNNTVDGYERDCKNDKGAEYLTEQENHLLYSKNNTFHVKPAINCPYWTPFRKEKIKSLLKNL